MFPVSGGTARFPHYAFGGAVGASFGWFSWLQAATVAPIEVSAMLTYAQEWDFAQGWVNDKNGVLTASGIVVSVILMALFTAINFLGVRHLAAANSAATWWKIAVPLLVIIVLSFANFDTGNLHAADGFAPGGLKAVLEAVSTGGIIFSYLGFEQADQLAGEASNPKRDIPLAIIGSMVIGTLIYIALQVAFILALPDSAIGKTWTDNTSDAYYTVFTGPFAQVATLLSLGWLAFIIKADAIISPAGTGLIYTTGSSRVAYGLSRNGYVPSIFEWTNNRGVPWVGLIAAFITGCICFLPFPSWQSLVGLITSASVLMYAGAPLSLSRLPQATARPGAAVPAADGRDPLAGRLRDLRAHHPVDHLGHRLEARRGDPDRLRHPDRQPGVPAQRAQADARLARGGLAAGVPRRHGRDRLHQLVRADGRPDPAVPLGHAGDGRRSASRSSTGRSRCA